MRGRGSGQPAAGVVHSQTGLGEATGSVLVQLHWPRAYEQSSPAGEHALF